MKEAALPAQGRSLLIATNHLQQIGGSEVVALEAAQYFVGLGCNVTIFTNWVGNPMAATIEAAIGIRPVTDPALIHPFTYDMLFVQHQVLGLFDYRPTAADRQASRIVLGRLARRGYLESGGWLHDRLLADLVLANSELTAEHLVGVGHEGPIINFRNAAPTSFFRPFISKPQTPHRILVVTNHSDASLMDAIGLLRQSISVRHIGRSGDEVTLITPEMISESDLVISIGKTVPYALAARVPVYVYDHFGGPGYLDAGNVETAARFNFSGKSARKLSGSEIAADVIDNYANGVAFARDIPQPWIDGYRLPRYLDLLLEPATISNAKRRQIMAANPFLVQERQLAYYIRASFVEHQRLAWELHRLQHQLHGLSAGARRSAEIAPATTIESASPL